MMKINFIDAENLSLVLTTLDTELGLAQPQLVIVECDGAGLVLTNIHQKKLWVQTKSEIYSKLTYYHLPLVELNQAI